MSEVLKILAKVPIFKGLDSKVLKSVLKKAQLQTFKKRKYILSEQEKGDAFYVIVSGLVKIFKKSSVGEQKTLTILKEGDFFGEMAELDSPIRSANAQAMVDTEVLVVPRNMFQKILHDHSQVMINILHALSARLRAADEQIRDLVFQNATGRVAIALFTLAEKYGVKSREGVKINIRLTQNELADLVGSAREIVARVIGTLRRNGSIQIHENGIIIICDKKKLRECIY